MNRGDVILCALPQADGKLKIRPALILCEFPSPYSGYLICGISSRLHNEIENFDEIVLEQDDDFEDSGLQQNSLIQLSFLSVSPKTSIARTIGKISEARLKKLLQKLSNYLIQEKTS